jgi:prephenate dehydrogenase
MLELSTRDMNVTKNLAAGGFRDVELLLTSIIHVWKKIQVLAMSPHCVHNSV